MFTERETTAFHWCIIHTKPRKEKFVARQLRERSIEYYCPRILKPFQVGTRIRPLFPGYLFAHIQPEESYYSIKWMPGVNRFMEAGGYLAVITQAQVEEIRQREGPNGLIEYQQEERASFETGEKVRVVRGLFSGFNGLFAYYLPGRDRVKILLTVLRYQTSVEIESAYVERLEKCAISR